MELAAAPGVPLLERSEELARIESALARARTGQGAFLVLEGPAGIGKTAVLSAARAAAAGQDTRVLRSRGAELEREFAFGVVRQFFEPVLASARGYGVARRLVLELFSLARGLGFQSLYIETTPGKMAEQYKWYCRLGFRETAKLNFADMDSVVAMELPLGASVR
jgi:GNAT superfamily N-acetyltransferase